MTTAVFIDGAFFVKRLRHYLPKADHYNATMIADIAMTMALRHLKLRHGKNKSDDDLYRIFFCDCPPWDKKMHRPISKTALDLAKSDEASFRKALHKELIKKRKFALRLGRLSDYHGGWWLKIAVLADLLKQKRRWESLTDDDFMIDISQIGVDMRIGVDIASVGLKEQANHIVLITGDADFVPASKLARREGADFILDPMHQKIPEDLFEHIDGSWHAFKPKNDDGW